MCVHQNVSNKCKLKNVTFICNFLEDLVFGYYFILLIDNLLYEIYWSHFNNYIEQDIIWNIFLKLATKTYFAFSEFFITPSSKAIYILHF